MQLSKLKSGILGFVLLASLFEASAQTVTKTKSSSKPTVTAVKSETKPGKYEIKVKVSGIKPDTCYLANYYGDKQYLKDTAIADKKGNFVFDGKTMLDGGIYLVVLPGKKYFETIVTNDENLNLNFETDTADLVMNMKIKNEKDKENTIFYEYLKYVGGQSKKVETLRKKIKEDSVNVTNQLIAIDKEVIDYRKNFIEKNKTSFVAKVFKASNEIEIPENPNPKDSTFAYRYYRNHYFDNIDWTDENILRTPIFHARLEKFINKIIPQAPDSMIVEIDKLILKAEGTKELFKYTVWYATNNSEQSKIMGMDALSVHLYKKYYLSKRAFWVEQKTMDKIKEQVEIKEPLLVGKIIPNAYMKDSTDTYRRLWDVKADYTVVFFYSPTCGHCQKETPKLYEFSEKNKGKVIVYAASIDRNEAEWKKFLKDYKVPNWINVWDKGTHTDFKKQYDIYSTPVIYLLDKSKRIIAKRLGVEQLQDFIDHYDKKK